MLRTGHDVPRQTPFFPRTDALCTSKFYKDWAGYYTVRSYDTHHDREYFALRQAAGLIDVTALYKYEVHGPDAADFLARVMVKDVRKLKVGRVTYLCWCDDAGKVLDDGTVSHLEQGYYRVTAAEPSLWWFLRNAHGYNVTIEESSRRIGALALQGPNSRKILARVSDADMDGLKFFGVTKANIGSSQVHITRTGYTGDLGYEIWIDTEHALDVYDALMTGGRDFLLEPAGLDAMDVTRVEAGFIMNGVDYFSANHCEIESRKSTPYELNLGWTVNLDREPFIGQAALLREKKTGPARILVGLVYDWDEYEALFAKVGLPAKVHAGAWRESVPVYDGARQVGFATCGAWSPILKKILALATVEPRYRELGSKLRIEVTVEYVRRAVTATVTKMPFFNPPRKRS